MTRYTYIPIWKASAGARVLDGFTKVPVEEPEETEVPTLVAEVSADEEFTPGPKRKALGPGPNQCGVKVSLDE